MDDADAAAVASWNATAVRVPLNQSCWLGINGDPNSDQGPPQPLTVAGYRQAVQAYVAALHAHGLYAILDLHWTGPLAAKADGQRPMPDAHSIDFWKSVAETFKDDPAVVFDLFNEPYSPAAVNDPAHPVTWACWRDGGCQLPISNDQTEPPSKTLYPAVGMQALVDTVRSTGATQPVLLGGLDYANDLTQWLTFRPNDPLGQEAASFHNYQGKACDNAGCWNSTIASVAAQVPVVTGEFDQDICAPSNFDEEYMTWADEHGVGYLAWGWWVLSPQEIADAGCSAYYLLSDYNGTPAAPNGTALHDHLAKLAGATVDAPGPSRTRRPEGEVAAKAAPDPVRRRGQAGRHHGRLQAPFGPGCSGTLSGLTVNSYALPRRAASAARSPSATSVHAGGREGEVGRPVALESIASAAGRQGLPESRLHDQAAEPRHPGGGAPPLVDAEGSAAPPLRGSTPAGRSSPPAGCPGWRLGWTRDGKGREASR